MKRLNLRRYILIIRDLQIDPRFSHACQFESTLNKAAFVFFFKERPVLSKHCIRCLHHCSIVVGVELFLQRLLVSEQRRCILFSADER